MKRKYIFDDFQLDDTGDREEVNMECGITIPIRSIGFTYGYCQNREWFCFSNNEEI